MLSYPLLGFVHPFCTTPIYSAIISLGRGSDPIRNQFSIYQLFANGEQGVWYDPSDLTTLFQDAAGTTPVTAVEQPVGLILDKRDLAYSTYFDGTGDYLSTPSITAFDLGTSNFTMEAWLYQTAGTFGAIANRRSAGTSTGWLFAASEFSANIGGSWRQSAITTTVANNNWIHVALVRNGSTFTLYHNGVSKGTYTKSGAMQDLVLPVVVGVAGGSTETLLTGYISNLRIVKGAALYTTNFTPPTAPLTPVAGTSLMTCGTSWSGNPAITNVGDTRADKLNPFTVGTGNHAYQTVSTKRPVLSARVNLLTKTEDISSTDWSVYLVASRTATKFIPSTAGGEHYIVNSSSKSSGAVQYTAIFDVKDEGYGFSPIVIGDWSGASASNGWYFCVDVSNGNYTAPKTFGSGWTVGVVSINRDSVTGICTVTCVFTTSAVSTHVGIGVYAYPSLKDTSPFSFVGNASSGIYLSKVSLVPANQSSLSYQRVNTATDYDTQGFPTYLKFDSIDDSMQTNSIDFTATDKLTVFAGVRKLSDATQMIAEASASADTTNGAFNAAVVTGGSLVGGAYISLRGTQLLTSGSNVNTAPSTYVHAGKYDISAVSDKLINRVNGTQTSASGSGSGGDGNFGNHPLYIGARAGTSLFFNGHLYSLIVRGAQSTAAQIESTEQWVNGKTAAF